MHQYAPPVRENDSEPALPFQPIFWTAVDDLIWFPRRGYGYYNVADPLAPYDRAYWEKYVNYACTDLGGQLTMFRVKLVKEFLPAHVPLIDVGIGCGQFIQSVEHLAYGFDVNPVAVDWLQQCGAWADPRQTSGMFALTFWDSFEHIQSPMEMLERRPAFVFMSLPIFRDADHVRRSKHFRRDEHFWYFTTWGLIREMNRAGYGCARFCDDETRLGREDIGTFVFYRR